MNRKILSFLLSLIFLFEVPTTAFAKRVSSNENVNKKTSSTLQESTISMILSKIKNNISSIVYTAITTGIVAFDLYLLYVLLSGSNPNQRQNDNRHNRNNVNPNIGHNVEQQPQQPPAPVYSEAFTMTEDIVQEIDTDNVPMVGIRNMGNTCYMNSVIQQLYRNSKFRNHILGQEAISKANCPFTWSVYHLFYSIKNNTPMDREEMRECLRIIGHNGRQQDTDEYIRLVVDRCSRELNVPEDIVNISNNADASLSQNGDRLIDIIKMGAPLNMDRVRQRIHEAHPDLAENDREFIRFQDAALEHPNLDDHNLPDIKTNNGTEIIVPVNRTTIDGAGKNNSKLSIPFKLNLERDFNIPDDNRVYTLSCVTVHLGRSARAGHYMVYEKSADRRWYEINDNSVTEVSYSDIKPIIERNSTILTYTLSDVAEQEPAVNDNGVEINIGLGARIKRFFGIN